MLLHHSSGPSPGSRAGPAGQVLGLRGELLRWAPASLAAQTWRRPGRGQTLFLTLTCVSSEMKFGIMPGRFQALVFELLRETNRVLFSEA